MLYIEPVLRSFQQKLNIFSIQKELINWLSFIEREFKGYQQNRMMITTQNRGSITSIFKPNKFSQVIVGL